MSEHATAPQASAQPAPGWYHQSDGQLRYWDGQAWTPHTAASQPGGLPPATTTYPASAPASVNVLAILTLILGFLPLIGCLAVVTGFIALQTIKRTPNARGRIPAIIGMTFGFLWLADLVLVVVNSAGTRS